MFNNLDLNYLRHYLGRDFLSPIQQFVMDGYTEKLFMDLNIRKEDTAIILGGYKGESASKLLKYNCKVIIFEPIPEFALELRNKFITKNVVVYDCAASNRDSDYVIFLNGEASSNVVKSDESIIVKCINFSKYLENYGRISLLEVNIEGEEYDLLENLIDTRQILNIEILLIQFHNYSFESELKRAQIRSRLNLSHLQVYCYDWIWEKWVIK